MLLNPDRKKMALMIIGSMKKKPDFVQKLGEKSDTGSYKLPDEDMPTDASAGLEAAADDILRAVKSDDAKRLMEALKDFFYMCDDMPHEENESGEEEGED